MRQIYPTCIDIAEADTYAGLTFPAGRPDRPLVAVNMVSTVDGKVALAGKAAGLGSRTDRLLMRQIRAAADALMVAAGTLRAEAVDPRVPPELAERRVAAGRPSQPLAIAVSRGLDLDPGHRFFVNGRAGTLVLTTESAPPERESALRDHGRVLRVGRDSVDLSAALVRLRAEFGIRSLLVEGGPSLNQALLDLGLVDELFWTVAPKLAGGRGLTLIQGDSPTSAIAARLDLVSLCEHAGELFARYRVARDSSG
jgi:riboflavin-specific deaminase-like protein